MERAAGSGYGEDVALARAREAAIAAREHQGAAGEDQSRE